jgi:hypothetical protein
MSMAVPMMLVIMAMIMSMIVGVVVSVIMSMVVVVIMMVVMVLMIIARHGIGATFGLERRLDRHDLCAKRLQERLDRRILAHAQAFRFHLDRHMAVAKMPGEPRQDRGISGARFEQRLGLGHDFDQTAVIQREHVVGAQPYRFGEIKFDAGSVDAEHKSTLGLALRKRKDQRVDRTRGGAFGNGEHSCGARHGFYCDRLN